MLIQKTFWYVWLILTLEISKKLSGRESINQDTHFKENQSDHSKYPNLILTPKVTRNDLLWENININEPPVARSITVEEIDELIETKEKREFPHLPCHTQAVERCVKLVTEAASLVYGQISRDGFIPSRIESRQRMLSFETKSQFEI